MICLANHKDGANILLGYVDGTLDGERRAELDRHMADCAECRRLVGVWDQLDEFAAPEVSPDFDRKLYARIAAEENGSWVERTWNRIRGAGLPVAWWHVTWWKAAVPMAACAALVIALIVGAPDLRGPSGGKNIVAGSEMEQVEQALEDLDLLAPAS